MSNLDKSKEYNAKINSDYRIDPDLTLKDLKKEADGLTTP